MPEDLLAVTPSPGAPIAAIPGITASGFGDVDFSLDRPRSPIRSARRYQQPTPIWMWFVTVGGLFVVALAGAVYWNWQQASAVAAKSPLTPEESRIAAGRGPQTTGFVPQPSGAVDIKKPRPGSSTEDIMAYVEHCIVKIDVYDEFNNRQGLGSGFVIDDSGLVATNYHVLDSAVKAEVLFQDGVRYGVEGYMAVRPESDLAILKLNGTPQNMRSLDLHSEGEPRTAAPVFSIGHPHGNNFQVTNGIVSRVVKTSQLPPDTQQFLRSGLSDQVDNVWVSHTAQISPGNSGGPLLNNHGEVIGVNSWVNQQINLGYAVHVRTLHDMQQHLFSSPQPLKDHRRPPPALAQVESDQWGVQVTAEKLRRLGSDLAARKYACDSDRAYQRLQELAMSVTYVLHMRDEPEQADDKLKELLPGLVREAEQIVAALTSNKWKSEQIESINKQATAGIQERLAGAFFFGTVERLLEGQEGARRGVLVKVADTGKILFLPLTDAQKDFKPAAGTKLLVAGVSFGAALQYGENPLEPQEAPIVLSETFIALPADTAF